ncbi:MAG: hypothetical protein H0T11_03475 [Chthoniobacterales bacterium]|nr:hypothetical protein [Chthoniobacterales bacterium]
MKQNTLTKLLAAGAVSAIALTAAVAQTTTSEETTTTGTTGAGVSATTTTAGTTGVSAGTSTSTSTSTLDGTGTITTYTPGSDYITMSGSAGSPSKYYYSKSTTVVDPTGATVDMKLLRPEMPVKYTYVKEGDRMVISKITVQKPVAEITKETTTTTTTSH